MLTLTDNAASAVKTVTAQAVQIETGGLRIEGSGAPDTAFQLTIVPAPETSDTIVEAEGARVFLDADAAVALDERILDARPATDGGVEFALASRS